MPRIRIYAPIICALATVLAATIATAHAERITSLDAIHETDFTGLTEQQRVIALRVMNDNPCNCGCNMTVAVCRVDDHSCRRSLIFARTIVDALREGKTESQVVEALKAKADTFVEARPPDDSEVEYDIDVTLNPMRGAKNAQVTIIEFSDFQCPYCASLQTTLDKVLENFPDTVRLVFKQYPLNIHQYARQAAAAALGAHEQGKFWEMHDTLFKNFTAINDANIRRWAMEIGLDMETFDEALQSGQYEAMVRKDMADGAAAKVIGTPTVFVNGRKINDRSYEGFKKTIQEALAELRTPAATNQAVAGGN